MFALQLADRLRPYIGADELPSAELVDLFDKAAFFVATNFTAQVPAADAKYLYLRYKKIRRPHGEVLSRFVCSV